MNLPTITEKTVKEHSKAIDKAKKTKNFKKKSNKIFGEILKENPSLIEVVLPTLESKRSEDYKTGYLAGITTIYDILRRQAKKSK